MIKPIMKDMFFLRLASTPATKEDIPVGQNLAETLLSHKDECVGMAANMIGVNKRIIAFYHGDKIMVMYNPVIIKKKDSYKCEEGCLSLSGVRPTLRYQHIKVQYQNEAFQTRLLTFTGFTAQIIQHECDHLEGIII